MHGKVSAAAWHYWSTADFFDSASTDIALTSPSSSEHAMPSAFLSPSAIPARAYTPRRCYACPQRPAFQPPTCRLSPSEGVLRISTNPSSPPRRSKRQKPPPAPVSPATATEASDAVRSALASRLDVHVIGAGEPGLILASLQAHSRRFNALVLLPTRPLAEAAAVELGEFSGSSRVILVSGRGVNALSDPARTAVYLNNAEKGAVVVATPLSLCRAFFRTGNGPKWLGLVERLVLSDPAHMAETGSLSQVSRILKYMPETSRRQTVVHSRPPPAEGSVAARGPAASASNAGRRMAGYVLRPRCQRVNWPTVFETSDVRAARIPQRFAVVKPSELLPALGRMLNEARAVPRHKVIVFFPTAKMVQFYATMFRTIGIRVQEVHGRRSPNAQRTALEEFRDLEEMVLFSSDLSSARSGTLRVTHVLQMGAPRDAMLYARRVASATPGEGSAVLLLADFEREIALAVLDELATPVIEATCYGGEQNAGYPEFVREAHAAAQKIAWQFAAGAFMSWIAEYAGKRKALGWSHEDLVCRATEWAQLTSGAGPWSVPPRFADRLKLWRVPGITVSETMERELGLVRETGFSYRDRSLDDVAEVASGKVGPRGSNALPRRLKEKKPKIEDWRKVLKRVSVEDLKKLKTINRKSPEGKKFMAKLVQKALAVSKPDVKKKKVKTNPPKKNWKRSQDGTPKKKDRISVHSWTGNRFVDGGMKAKS